MFQVLNDDLKNRLKDGNVINVHNKLYPMSKWLSIGPAVLRSFQMVPKYVNNL